MCPEIGFIGPDAWLNHRVLGLVFGEWYSDIRGIKSGIMTDIVIRQAIVAL